VLYLIEESEHTGYPFPAVLFGQGGIVGVNEFTKSVGEATVGD